MNTPLQFEQRHGADWQRLEQQLAALEGGRRDVDAAAVARDYRRVCEQLALVRARGWPLHLADRLDALAQRAHRLVYRQPAQSLERLRRLLAWRFPQALRRNGRWLLLSALVFTLPMLAIYLAVRLDPAFALTVIDAQQLASFDSMYGDGATAFGRERDADTDWVMFGYYVRNNISVAFQCFATGLLAGLGSLFFLAFNGLLGGAVAGYLDARGLGHNFWPFVATHAAFELTAIVIAGAGGLRLGHALLAPGRLTRSMALQQAAADGALLIGGAIVMLVMAAFVEAFWSSARWLPPGLKFGVAALCWTMVAVYWARAGRRAWSADHAA